MFYSKTNYAGKALRLGVQHVTEEVRVGDRSLERGESSAHVSRGGDNRNRGNDVEGRNVLHAVGIHVVSIDTSGKTLARDFGRRVNIPLVSNGQLVRSIDTPGSRLTHREALLIEGLLVHDAVERKTSIHGTVCVVGLCASGIDRALIRFL